MLLLLPLLLLLPSCSSLSCQRPCLPVELLPSSCTSGEVVFGPCGCQECARGEWEGCGGPWNTGGICAAGLTCLDAEEKGEEAFDAPPGVCRASCQEGSTLGWDYTGTMATTLGGRTCQAWDSSSPHGCGGEPCFPEPWLENNHCRNPDNETGGVWCYTTDDDKRWEYCDVPQCSERPICPQVLCCGSDGTTYPTPCAAPPGVTCVSNTECLPKNLACQKFGSEWSPWSTCSDSCQSTRSRILVIGCGKECRQEKIAETRMCPSCCPLSPTLWTPWSSCPVACGEGISRRSRDVVLDRDGDCYRQRIEQEDVCNAKRCPVIDPCPKICTLEYAPVCGTDGETYGNSCQLTAASCLLPPGLLPPGLLLTLAYEGPCQTGCPKFCTEIRDPVCGSDGLTYRNECELKGISCTSLLALQFSITLNYKGECKQDDCPKVCPKIFKPVCGSDNVTYDNACFLQMASCANPTIIGLKLPTKIILAYEGKCKKDRCDGEDSCCTSSNRCGAGEGDCDSDSECLEGFTCGVNNCDGENFEDDDDCCEAVRAIEESEQCSCGVRPTDRRIFGGIDAEEGEFPWIGMITHTLWGPWCGATLIADKWVLTAAHCFHEENAWELASTFRVVFGSHNIRDRSVTKTMEAFYRHPQYSTGPFDFDFDFAIVKLTSAVDLSVYPPACLPSPSEDFSGRIGWVYGWGATDTCTTIGPDPKECEFPFEWNNKKYDTCTKDSLRVGVDVAPWCNTDKLGGWGTCSLTNCPVEGALNNPDHSGTTLQKLEVPIVSQTVCQTSDVNTLCGGRADGGSGFCSGDSGGPLTVPDSNNKHTLAGVVNKNLACGKVRGEYDEYADVAAYMKFIEETIMKYGKGKTCEA